MLKDLLIQNLILMESCSIEWDPKLNVITGETGSGKTAILHGLRLLLGQKLDTSLIRRGANKGFVQARFEFPFSKELILLLTDAGIPFEEGSLILSREVSIEGKSKNQVNERWVSLSFLQKIGSFCIQIVDQHSCQELRHSDTQRDILDCFGALQTHIEKFSRLFTSSKELRKTLENLQEYERQKERELPFCLQQMEELNAIHLKEGDEEALFQEYSNVSSAEEVSTHIDQIFELISQSPASFLSQLQKAKVLCKPFSSLHKAFQESLELFDSVSISLQEVQHLLRSALSDFDPDPKKKELLEAKLSLIDRMKKKYGSSILEWEEYRKTLKEKIDLFDRLEEEKSKTELTLEQTEKELTSLSLELTKQRKQVAKTLESKLKKEIQSLNMKGAALEIKIEKQARTLLGEDSVHFWLAANQGEAPSLVKDSSSGGELARLLLALKLALAEKNHTPTLIFDEIDAGVGGETSGLIGEKLKSLSSHRQIICITHFPQVACTAHKHLRVSKHTVGERTYAQVQTLDSSLRESELLRMLGGKKTLSFYDQS
jgi:DNA repair protein RecN (Recombination protein N)